MNQLTSSVLYSLFTERRGENWVFSPASYLEAMSLLALCLKDENLSELFAVAPDIGDAQAKGLETHNVMLYTAEYRNALNQAVVEAMKARGGSLEAFDGPAMINRVNAIVREKTHGKIDNLMSPGDWSEYLKFVLLNCVYFKRDWRYKFTESWRPEPFNGATKVSQVKYLNHQIVGQRYHEDAVLDIVELPYLDSNVACYVIVPRVSLFEVFSDLRGNLAKLAQVKAGLDVNLTVPPFETETTIPLNDLTKAAGVTKIFRDSQDWSMVDWDKVGPMVFGVSTIRQKAYIDFTKDGTTAAAATMVCITGCCSGMSAYREPPPVKYVRADKPFLYVLADRDSHQPLFVGVVNEVPDSPEPVPRDSTLRAAGFLSGSDNLYHYLYGN